MRLPRSLRHSRSTALALALLAIGLVVVGVNVVVDDFNDRRAQRAAVTASSSDALDAHLNRLTTDLNRQLGEIERTASSLAGTIADDPDAAALAAALDDQRVADRIAAVDAVGLQNPLAEIVWLDRFGSEIVDDRIPVDPQWALNRFPASPFVVGVDDPHGVALLQPVDNRGNWLILMLDGVDLAPGATFSGVASTASSQWTIEGETARLVASRPVQDRFLVAERVVDHVDEAPASWLPFAARVAGLLAALTAAAVLGRSLLTFNRRVSEIGSKLTSGSSIGIEQNIVGVAELDAQGVIIDANRAYCEQVGRTREELIGVSLISLTEPADRSRHLSALTKMMNGGVRSTEVEHRIATEGEEIWVLEHLSRDFDTEGEETRILVQSQDITFRRQAAWQLARQALHDELTGLANRAMLVHQLSKALEAPPGTAGPPVSVMFIDVDRFKMVNDSLGHEVGDRLLEHVATRMSSACGENDIVSRFGGDEFVIMCETPGGLPEALTIAERIRKSVADPFVDNGNTVHQTLSIGIAMSEAGEMSADELLGNADAAMYRAKQRGRNRVEVFDEGMRHLLDEQVALENELRAAIEAESVSVYFQPIVDSHTYATAGFESLIRWHHPERGLMTPGQFLPVAETAGLVDRLDALALKKTCTRMARWAAKYPLANSLYVSSNKVPKDFAKFVQQIREIVALTGLPPGLLVVEVVENALIDNADGALEAIEALKDMGVRVAIDDFGTGYSSLSYLTQFKPTTLKIDQAFVRRLPDDDATASVVQAITDMALALDINVIAEGVETWEQAEMLQRIGVPYFQGYLFAKPRPADEIEAWFEANVEENARSERAATTH